MKGGSTSSTNGIVQRLLQQAVHQCYDDRLHDIDHRGTLYIVIELTMARPLKIFGFLIKYNLLERPNINHRKIKRW